MKKEFFILIAATFAFMSCVSTENVTENDFTAKAAQQNLLMPDGQTAFEAKFFDNKKDAETYAAYMVKMKTLDGYHYISSVSKSLAANLESSASKTGDFLSKSYKSTENEAISNICSLMKDSGTSYGMAYARFDDGTDNGIYRYTIFYKPKTDKLSYQRWCFYSETSVAYQKSVEKEQKLNDFSKDFGNHLGKSLANSVKSRQEYNQRQIDAYNKAAQMQNEANAQAEKEMYEQWATQKANNSSSTQRSANIANLERIINTKLGATTASAARGQTSIMSYYAKQADIELYESLLSKGWSSQAAAEEVYRQNYSR